MNPEPRSILKKLIKVGDVNYLLKNLQDKLDKIEVI